MITLGAPAPGAAQSCTYTVTPTSVAAPIIGAPATLSVSASAPSCWWTATSDAPWLLVTGIARGYAEAVLHDSPVGYWRLSETSGTTAVDASGHGYVGTYTGGFALGQSSPIWGGTDKAVLLNGADSTITVGDVAAMRFTTALTVETWIRVSSNAYGAIVSKYTSGGHGYFLAYDPSNLIRWYASKDTGTGDAFVVWSPTSIRDNAWHHVVGTYDGATGTATLYLDGTLVGTSGGGPASINTSTHALQIGAGWGDMMLGGYVDEVAVYDHALTGDQVGQHYAAHTTSGADVLSYETVANPTATGRAATLTVAGQTIPVTQAGQSCSYAVSPSAVSAPATASSGTVVVGAALGCSIAPSSNASWLTVTGTSPAYAKQVIADGPAGYWRFAPSNSSYAEDSSGHDRIGLYTTGVTRGVSGAIGDGDKAASFDGSAGSINFGNMAAFNFTTAVTVEAWANFWAGNLTQPIVTKEGNDGGYFLIYDGNMHLIRWLGKGGTDVAFQLTPSVTVGNQAWHHLVGTYDGGTGVAALYVDGVLAGSATGTASALWTTTQPLAIGSWPVAGAWYGGSIDDVAIYDHALTAAQVAVHYTLHGIGGTDTVSYGVATTTTSLARAATLTINGQTTTVTQTGGTCTYSVSPTTVSVDAAGGPATLALTTLDACAWSAASGPDWMTVTTPSGTSSGSVGYTVAPNTTSVARTNHLVVAGQTITVTQAPCGYTITPANPAIGGSTSANTLTVTTAAICTWTATAPSPWLRITEPDAYADQVRADQPAAYWRLDELSGTTAADATGHGHDGSYAGGVTLDRGSQLIDGDTAVRFDGATGHVVVPDDAALRFTTALSVETWVAFTHSSWSNYGPIVSKRGPTDGGYFLIRDYPSGQIRWQGVTATDTSVFGVWSPGVPDDGAWHHLVGTYSAALGTAVLYLDGVVVASASGSAAVPASTAPLQIAAWANNSDTFNGSTDEVAVYDHALTAAQVAAHYAARSAVPMMTGSGTVNYVARANGAVTPRTGTLSIAGQSILIAQAGAACSAVASPTNIAAPYGGGPGAVALTIPDGCPWTATANDAWLTVSPAVPYESVVLMDNPLGYWRLNEGFGTTAWDTSGHNANGTYVGGVTQSQPGALGDGDTSVQLDGSTGMVNVGTNAAFALTDEVTVEAWVKLAVATHSRPIISKYTGGTQLGYVLEYDGWDTGARLRWIVRRAGDADITNIWAPNGILDGVWHQVIGTYKASTGVLAMYIDGALVSSSTNPPAALVTSTQPLKIGAWMNEDMFDNAIDEVAVYDHALTTAQIAAHWAARGVGAVDLVNYSVAANPDTLPRTGIITVADQSVTVAQAAAPCAYTLSTLQPWAGWWNAIASITVTTSSNCSWSTSSLLVPWGNLQVSTSTTYHDQIIADGPEGYWRLDDMAGTNPPAADSSGHGHDGAYVGGVTRWFGGALPNGDASATFDGAGGHVTVGNVAALGFTTDTSVEAWVQFTDTTPSASGPIVSKMGGGAGYVLTHDGNTGKLRWQADAAGGATIFALWTPTNVNDGLWHHVVGTYSTATGLAALYVDGAVVASQTGLNAPIPTTTAAFQIGGWGSNTDTFKGSLDEVAVYNHALTAVQIADHASLRHETITGSGTVTYYMTVNPTDQPRSTQFWVADRLLTLTQNGAPPWLSIDGYRAPAAVGVRDDGTVQVAVGDPHGSPYDWVGLYRVGDDDNSYIDNVYVTGSRTLQSDGVRLATVTLTVPQNTSYQYEARLFTDAPPHAAVSPMIFPRTRTIAVTSPAAGSTFTDGQPVTIVADPSTWGGPVTRVDFFVDASLVGSANASPWQIGWTATAGTHTVTALAVPPAGATGTNNGGGGSGSGGSGGSGGSPPPGFNGWGGLQDDSFEVTPDPFEPWDGFNISYEFDFARWCSTDTFSLELSGSDGWYEYMDDQGVGFGFFFDSFYSEHQYFRTAPYFRIEARIDSCEGQFAPLMSQGHQTQASWDCRDNRSYLNQEYVDWGPYGLAGFMTRCDTVTNGPGWGNFTGIPREGGELSPTPTPFSKLNWGWWGWAPTRLVYLYDVVPAIVDNYGGPIRITSAFRNPAHNWNVETNFGSNTQRWHPLSRHVYGDAVDVKPRDAPSGPMLFSTWQELADAAITAAGGPEWASVESFNYETGNTHVHLDLRKWP